MLSVIRNIFSSKDELIGLWTCEDDGSGLINFFGWSLEFLENGKGLSRNWSTEQETQFEFNWKRISEKQIAINIDNGKWETITYRTVKLKGAYYADFIKLMEADKAEFWNSNTPLYKRLK